MYFFNAKSLLINLWTIIEEEILDQGKKIILEDETAQWVGLATLIILIAMSFVLFTVPNLIKFNLIKKY